MDRVAFVLDLVYLHPMLFEAFELPQSVHPGRDLLRYTNEDPSLLDGCRGGLPDLVQHEDVGGSLNEVHDVVQAGSECVDVLAVERRDEGRVEIADDLVRVFVALVLLLPYQLVRRGRILIPLAHLEIELRTLDRVVRAAVEEVEEGGIFWEKTDPHAPRAPFALIQAPILSATPRHASRAYDDLLVGKETVNVEPRPRSLSAVTVAPWLSAR